MAPVPAKQTAATVTLDGTTTGGSIHSLALNGSSTSDPSLSASTLHRPTSPISLLSSTSKGAGHRMSNAKLDLKHAKKNSNGSNSGINSPLRISSAAVANVSSPSSASGKNTAVSPPVRSNRINGDGSVASSSSCFASACSSSSYPPSPISKVVGIDDEGGESTEAAVNTAASTGTSSNNSGGGIVPSSSSSSAPWWSWLLKRAAQHYTSFIQVSALPPAVAPALVIAIMTVTFMAVFKAVIPQRYRDLVKTRVMQMIQILLQSA